MVTTSSPPLPQRLQAELSSSQRCLREATERSDHELELLRRARDALQRSHHQLEGDLAASRSEVTALRSTVAQLTADASAVQCHLDATKVRGEEMEGERDSLE